VGVGVLLLLLLVFPTSKLHNRPRMVVEQLVLVVPVQV
jgi:hypothetical protein